MKNKLFLPILLLSSICLHAQSPKRTTSFKDIQITNKVQHYTNFKTSLIQSEARSTTSLEQMIKDFFTSQLDKEMIEIPDKELYNKKINTSSIAQEQDKIWKLWVEVNKKSLEQSEFSKVLEGQHELIWDLPQQQKMKATMLTRGTTPEGGFPLFISLHGGGKDFVNNPWDSQSNTIAYNSNISLATHEREWFTLFFIPRMADDRIGRWYLQPQRALIRKVCRLAAVSGFVNPKKIYIFDKLAELQKQAQNDYIHKVNMIPGIGHHISPYTHTTWLLQHEKHTYPNNITYLYYNMTSDYDEEAYSNGVYYLDFRELKHQPNAEVLFKVEHNGNIFNITTDDINNTKVQGSLGLFINDVDFSKPIEVYKEGKLVFRQLVQPNIGAMADALSLWCDPLRIFPAKITIPMNAHHFSTGITTQVASDTYEIARYNILGKNIDKPERGINIVKMSDGTTHKELIK